MAKFLICGLATDGPNYIPTTPRTERDFRSLYGAQFTERRTITATASSMLLTYTPLDLPANQIGTRTNYLFSPVVSGQTLFFGSVGGTGAQVDVTYTPYTGMSDLLWSARKWLEETNDVPYLMRVGGECATLTIQGWTFCARYPGARYNAVSMMCTGGVLTISGLEPNYPTMTYNYPKRQFKALIDRDFELGVCPVRVQSASGTTMQDFVATNLTGGTDGTMSDATITNFFDLSTIPDEVSHILFLTPITQSFLTQLASNIRDGVFQPRMIFCPMPTYTAPTTGYIQSLATSLPYRHNLVCGVLGSVESTLRTVRKTRYSAEMVALGFARAAHYNLSNVQIPALSCDPVLTADELTLLKLNGIVCVTRHILRDISTYEGCVLGLGQSFLFSSKTAEVQAIASSYLRQYLGRSLQQGPQPAMQDALKLALSTINWLRIESVECVLVESVLYTSIVGSMPNEILTITFQIRNF